MEVFTSDKGVGKCVCPRSFVCVCLSVSKITQQVALLSQRGRVMLHVCQLQRYKTSSRAFYFSYVGTVAYRFVTACS